MGDLGTEEVTHTLQSRGTKGSGDVGGKQDARAVWSCVLAGTAIVAEVVAYLVAVGYGIVATLISVPFFLTSIVLSIFSLRDDAYARMAKAGRMLGIGGLVCSWVFFIVIWFAGFFAALDPSTLSDWGPLAYLNWN